jgi:hypothetical protein
VLTGHQTPFAGLSLKGELRPFQRLALDAFEADRAAGRRSTHLVRRRAPARP